MLPSRTSPSRLLRRSSPRSGPRRGVRRGVTVAALAVVVAVAAAVVWRASDDGYRLKVAMPSAVGVVKGTPVQIAGFAGLALWPQAMPLGWVVLLGAGLGGCFALSMVVALDHLENPADAGALSALMQGGGFLLAALPPWIVAVLHDLTGGFVAGWLMHLGFATLVALLVVRFAPEGYARSMNLTAAPAG